MLLMASGGLALGRVAREFPESPLWKFLAYQTEHVAWRGCSLWDLIQPSFMFIVGVAMPFSLASRLAKGQTFPGMLGHAVWRALLLISLGIFLRSVGRAQTNFTFEDVLTQIGLGYVFLFLIAWARPTFQAAWAAAILVGYWLAFALYPVPGPGFDFAAVGVPETWTHLTGFAAHWDKNTNLASAFDAWFLNLFPREKPFLFNGGGYLTLNFIPSLVTMLLGLLAGEWLRSNRSGLQKWQGLVCAGVACLALGAVLDLSGVAPSVKRIWSPGWVIFSAGWTFLLLAAFYGIVDLKGQTRWAFPLIVVGMNSIAMYVLAGVFGKFVRENLNTHLGRGPFEFLGAAYAPILQSLTVLTVLWLVCWWMYRRKLFLKI
jgi:heparan-alpha-glucosaminide N-acetyltransferase